MNIHNMPILADQNHCTGCLACADSCPVDAIKVILNDEYHQTYHVDTDICIQCGCCEKVCPIMTKYEYGNNVLRESNLYVGWCSSEELRKESSSGGIFAALAKAVIVSGGVAIGASLEGYKVTHRAVESVCGISKLQGSKYTQSNTLGIYKEVKKILKDDRWVLFSGLGCQIAGLLSYLGDKFDKSKLLTVDLVCGGIPSNFLVKQFEKENIDKYPSINGFRKKQLYEFSVCDKEGHVNVIPLSKKPLPLSGFYTELTNRMSCYDCHFAYAHRNSDITIADFWGDSKFPEQHINGISAIVIHSKKGRNWIEKSEIEYYEASWEDFLIHNHRMVDGHNDNSKSKARKNLSSAIANYNRIDFLCTYANYATFRRPWTWVSKIWRYAISRLKRNPHLELINELLSQ